MYRSYYFTVIVFFYILLFDTSGRHIFSFTPGAPLPGRPIRPVCRPTRSPVYASWCKTLSLPLPFLLTLCEANVPPISIRQRFPFFSFSHCIALSHPRLDHQTPLSVGSRSAYGSIASTTRYGRARGHLRHVYGSLGFRLRHIGTPQLQPRSTFLHRA